MDFSLTAIDLSALRLHLSSVISSNKDKWKELSVHELANKEQERQAMAANIQSNASPSQHIPSGRDHDQSQGLNASPTDKQDDMSADQVTADHLTWNGAGSGEEKEEKQEVPGNA
ncbi:hypothetical protein LDENG_00249010 [Lucifuga dentata]|nr:hypothetical protein LDENG_00249010 [Lucifuga dentata]